MCKKNTCTTSLTNQKKKKNVGANRIGTGILSDWILPEKAHTDKTKGCKLLERVYHASPSLDRGWHTLQINNSQSLTNYHAHAHFSIAASRLKYAGVQQQSTTNNDPDRTTHMFPREKYILAGRGSHNPTNFALNINFVQFPQLQRLRFICTYQKKIQL